MDIRLKPLSEDAVDAYTHTWSVLVFLLLAFILLFVPSKQSGIEHGQLPEFEANCWCPAHFEDSQISYANAFCSGYLTSVFQGTLDPGSDSFLYTSPKSESKRPKRVERKREKGRFILGSAQEHCSLFLFILAICLRLPQAVWSVLSGCCNTVNVAQTLQSVESGNLIRFDCRQQRYACLMRAFMDYTHKNQSMKAATCLYLVMKVLMLVVIIAEIAFVAICILPQLPIFAWSGPIKDLRMHQQLPVYRCPITTVDYVYDREDSSVQCYLTERQQMQWTHQRQLLVENPMTSSNVFLIALTNLAFLFLINAFNTIQWLVTLASDSTRSRLGLKKDAPLDLVFLVQMAQANLSIDVAVGLAEAISGGHSAETNDQ